MLLYTILFSLIAEHSQQLKINVCFYYDDDTMWLWMIIIIMQVVFIGLKFLNACFSFGTSYLAGFVWNFRVNNDNMLCGVLRLIWRQSQLVLLWNNFDDDDESDQYACMGIHGMWMKESWLACRVDWLCDSTEYFFIYGINISIKKLLALCSLLLRRMMMMVCWMMDYGWYDMVMEQRNDRWMRHCYLKWQKQLYYIRFAF